MRDVDQLVQLACRTPADDNVRRRLVGVLLADGKVDLADAVEADETGRPLLTKTAALATEVGLPPTLELLWAAHTLLPRMQPPVPLVLPSTFTTVPQRPATPRATQTEFERWRRRVVAPAPYAAPTGDVLPPSPTAEWEPRLAAAALRDEARMLAAAGKYMDVRPTDG